MLSDEEKRAKRNEYARKWYAKNAERLRPAMRDAYYKDRLARIKSTVEYKRRNKDKAKGWASVYRKKHAAEIAAYNAATKAMQKVRSQRRYAKHKEEVLAQCRAYYLENKKEVLDRNAAWRKANRDRVRVKQREYIRRKLATDPAFAFIHLARRRMLNALKGVGSKSARTVELLGCTGEEAVKHIEKQFAPGMSWANRKEWHIDHIKPVSKFDLTKPEEQKKAFHYTNLQPLWAWDNRSKGAK